MSVLIKGMQMPKNCKECPFLYDGNACYAMNLPISQFLPLVCNGSTDEYPLNEFPYCEKRVDWCPLVEVPTPHGSLIDADALVYSRVRIAHEDGTIGGYNAVVMSSEIKHAPTVIEAEE